MGRVLYDGPPITPTELSALRLMANGYSYGQASTAGHMDARGAVQRARRKLRARNMTHAVALALDAGLIHLCGTVRGYYWHQSLGEVACTPCRAARGDHERPRAYYRHPRPGTPQTEE